MATVPSVKHPRFPSIIDSFPLESILDSSIFLFLPLFPPSFYRMAAINQASSAASERIFSIMSKLVNIFTNRKSSAVMLKARAKARNMKKSVTIT